MRVLILILSIAFTAHAAAPPVGWKNPDAPEWVSVSLGNGKFWLEDVQVEDPAFDKRGHALVNHDTASVHLLNRVIQRVDEGEHVTMAVRFKFEIRKRGSLVLGPGCRFEMDDGKTETDIEVSKESQEVLLHDFDRGKDFTVTLRARRTKGGDLPEGWWGDFFTKSDAPEDAALRRVVEQAVREELGRYEFPEKGKQKRRK